MDNNINMGNNAPMDAGTGSNTKTIITVIVIVVLAIVGYFYFRSKPATEVVPTNTATVKLNPEVENAAALEKEAANINVGDTGTEFNAIDDNLKGI